LSDKRQIAKSPFLATFAETRTARLFDLTLTDNLDDQQGPAFPGYERTAIATMPRTAGSLLLRLTNHPLARKAWSDRQLNLFVAEANCPIPTNALQIRVNDFDHINRFEQTTSWLTRDGFISFASEHCARPDCYIFTVADADGPLLGYALAEANALQSDFGEVDQSVRWRKLTATMYGGFVHPQARGRRIHDVLRAARINFLIGERGMRWVVGAVEADNSSAMQSTRKAGYFRMVATLRTRYRLGIPSRSVTVIDKTFDAEFVDAE
jgi:GNAT superfamily N-acetyltransferase